MVNADERALTFFLALGFFMGLTMSAAVGLIFLFTCLIGFPTTTVAPYARDSTFRGHVLLPILQPLPQRYMIFDNVIKLFSFFAGEQHATYS